MEYKKCSEIGFDLSAFNVLCLKSILCPWTIACQLAVVRIDLDAQNDKGLTKSPI